MARKSKITRVTPRERERDIDASTPAEAAQVELLGPPPPAWTTLLERYKMTKMKCFYYSLVLVKGSYDWSNASYDSLVTLL